MTHDIPGIVIFDIDGTLTDSVAQHQRAFESALRTFSFPDLRTDWSHYTHHTDSAIFQQAWEEAQFDGRAKVADLESRYQLALEHEFASSPFTEIAGATLFLQWLKERAWTVVYATGSLRFGAEKKLAAVGVVAEEVILVTASEFSTREDILREAIRVGSQHFPEQKPGAIISIGDGLWDLKTARNLALPFIGIGRDAKAELLKASGAPVFSDFHDLMSNGTALLK